MAALPPNTTQEDFYNDDSLQGRYQYVTLSDIINNFILMYTGDTMLIPSTIKRDIILFHAKRGLQEMNYDVHDEVKAVEIEINPDTLTLILPEDYVNLVRVSWIDDNGIFHPMVKNEDTRIAKSYLQDNEFELIFDSDGNVITASSNTYDQTSVGKKYTANSYSACEQYYGGRYGLDTSKANSNGWFTLNKRSGIMHFSSNVGSKIIVLEYISDGLEFGDPNDIVVHKFMEKALYLYIESEILSSMGNTQEYIIKRKRKQAHIEKMKTKSRLDGITFEDLMQVLKGRGKRIK